MISLSPARVLSSVALLCFFVGGVWAQPHDPVPEPRDPEESVPDSVVGEWQYDATARLNVAQAAYKDWEEGSGSDSFTLSSTLDGQISRRGENWIQSHELRFAIGFVNQEEQEFRKSEDQIHWNSSLRYEGDDFFRLFNPTIAGIFRSQFASGFSYSSNPYANEVPEGDPRADLQPPVETSAFFAPAFLTESVGLTYEPLSNFTMRIGAASKQTIVWEKRFRVLYGVREDHRTRVEGGAEFASSLDHNLTENIRYRSQVNVFFSLNQTEKPPDARWENRISLEVNDWLSTDLEFVALYDQDITSEIQLKETVSIGLSFTLI
jgi:hypothetical protein